MAPAVPAARSAVASALALLVTAMVFSHPYTGIRHDSILYLGDALARIEPGRFDEDLYFLFGSQGRYTLLSTVYAALIRKFGVGTGTTFGMVATTSIYLVATWYFVRSFAPARLSFYCALSVILGWSLYGGYRVFAFGEPFLTARSFAEPAVLFGLGMMYRGRRLGALSALAFATVFHPLIAAGSFLVFWFYMVEGERRYLHLLPAGVVALALLGWSGLGPFSDVFAVYDREWLALAQDSNPQAFVLEWVLTDYGIVAYAAVLLVLAIRHAGDVRFGRLLRACLFAGLAATAASFLLVDVAHSTFFGKLQIWRALWIMQWVAIATLPLTFVALWRTGENGRTAALLLAIGWVAPFSLAPALVATLAFVLDRFRSRIVITSTLTRIVMSVTVIAMSIVVEQQVARAVHTVDSGGSLLVAARQVLAANIVLYGVIAALWRYAARSNRIAQLLVCALLVAALAAWDQRSAWTRQVEARPLGAYIWPGLIPPDARVYWYHDLVAPWILLGRGNYYTTQQGSGAVFSRDMVVELERRRKLTGMLEFQEQLCQVMNSLNGSASACEPDAVVVRNVCTEGGVDYVVLQNTLEGASPAADFATGVVENGYEKKFFLYRCSTLRAG